MSQTRVSKTSTSFRFSELNHKHHPIETNNRKSLNLTEQSALLDCTHPESSFLMQQAVSLSRCCPCATSLSILASLLIHGANFAPKCIRSAALGPSQKFAGSWYSTWNSSSALIQLRFIYTYNRRVSLIRFGSVRGKIVYNFGEWAWVYGAIEINTV